MRRILAFACLLATAACALEPQLTVEPCPACKGKRSLSITPPNLGQHDGEIDVTPGQPFTNHRWDVKHAKCPLCKGTGRHVLYRKGVPTPPPEKVDGLAPCPQCRWSCVTACRKCRGSGFTGCPACNRGGYAASSTKNGKAGWVVTRRNESMSRSTSTRYSRAARRAQQQTVVKPCETCGAVARVVCPECDGKGAVICRKCHGEGGVPRKEPRR